MKLHGEEGASLLSDVENIHDSLRQKGGLIFRTTWVENHLEILSEQRCTLSHELALASDPGKQATFEDKLKMISLDIRRYEIADCYG